MTISAPPDVLTPEHRHQLAEESGIPADIIAEEGIRSLGATDELPVPDVAFRHPNSWKGQRFPYWPPNLGPGLLFPFTNPAGDRCYQFKPDVSRLQPKDDGTYRTIKYETAGGSRLALIVPQRVRPLLQDVTVPLRITEGVKKTLSAAGRGYCIIGLMGVDSWVVKPGPNEPSVPLPDWDDIALTGRLALIEFDSDTATNQNVQAARARLGRFLRERGATAVYVEIPMGPNGEKQGIDDFIAAGGNLAERENAAIIAAINTAPKITRDIGSDGEQTCQNCAPLAEQLREHKLADQMRRARAFPAGEVEVLRYYTQQASVAISQGKSEVPVWGDLTEKLTGQSPSTATRLHKAYKAFQDDPEIAPILPWRLRKDTDEKGKDHYRIVIPVVPDEPSERTTAAMLAKLAHLQRPDDRGAHGGRRDACPKCESPLGMARTTQDVCQNDECGHVVTHPTKYIGRAPFHDETESPRVRIGADFYAVEVQGQGPFHDETTGTYTYSRQDETVKHRVSFVTRDDTEAAAGPRYQGEAPEPEPEPWIPPPVAPDNRRAWSPRRYQSAAVGES